MSYEELVSWAEEEAQHLKTPPKPRTVSKKVWDSLTPKKNDIGACGSGTNVEFGYKQTNAPNATLDVDEFDYGDTGASFESVDDKTGAPSQADNGKGKMIEKDNIVNKVVDKGKGKMIEEERPAPARKTMGRNKGIVIEENDNPNVMDSDSSDREVEVDEIPDYSMLYSDSESEYSDRSVDYLSEGEDELIQLRKRNSEAKRAPKVSKQKPCSDKEGGEGSSRPKTLYGLGETETVLEHEEFMDDLVRKMRECDDDAELTDPFKLVETRVEKYPTHDQDTHWKMKKPKVGEKFTDVAQFKECLTYYGLANGYSIWCYRSSKTQIIARCGQRPERIKDPKKGKLSKWKRYPSERQDEGVECPWRCYAKQMTTENSFQVFSLKDEHTCTRDFKFGTLVNYKWIGKHFGNKIRMNPDIKLHEIADMVMKKYKCIVSPSQCRRAKRWALNEGENTMVDHYGYIRSYAKAILESNDGSTVRVGVTVNPDDQTYFDRFYVCFNGLKEGWKKGCRRVIALDGCFLKKPNVGEILTAIGRDRNNHTQDLELPTGNGLTLMSDQHKGLIEAVKDVMPHAEHRQCARHIYEGFRKHYSGVEFRNLFWAASKASYPGLFNKIMDKIKRANPNAYQYLLNKDPKTWSRAYFHIGTNCEAVENGFSECFNVVLVRVRNKPLITMLEAMRVIVMERMNTMRRMLDKWTDDICPNIQKRLELIKDQQRFWHVIPAGGNLFEVRNGSRAYSIDEKNRTCRCRMWQLSGLPCSHAIAVIFKLNRRAEEYVPDCFRKRMFHDAYHQYLTPVGGMSFWPDCSDMSRGHNKSGCKNQTVLLPPKPPAKKGRPRKNPIPSESVDDQTEPLVPPSVPIPPVEEHLGSSQYEVGGSMSMSGRGRGRGPRLGRLGAWFGIDGNESDSTENTQEETMHDSEIQESQTVQTAPT
ncbi:pentatricopeptide repeat-containing protein [Tanacetum coccineum]